MSRTRRPSRAAKLTLVGVIAAVLVIVGWALSAYGSEAPGAAFLGVGGRSDAITTSVSTTVPKPVDPGQARGASVTSGSSPRRIAAIVYLDANGLPQNTFGSPAGLHATEVYVYVAYFSDAYCSPPATR